MNVNSPFKEITLAAILYSACVVLYFFPVLPSIAHSLIGPPEDNRQFYWFLWYGKNSLLRGDWPFLFSRHIYYPEGAGLYYANYYYYGVFLSVLLGSFMNLVLVFNLLVLHTFVFAGVAAFLLLKYLTGDTKASLLGGFVFGFNPSHVAHSLHHVTIASIQFVPLFVLFFIKMLKENKRSHILWAAFFLVLNALCDWNYLVFGLIFIGLASGYRLYKKRAFFLKEDLKKIIGVLILTFVALSPLIVPMLIIGAKNTFLRKLDGYDIYVADLVAFVTPSATQWLSATQGWFHSLNDQLKQESTAWEAVVYLGVMNLAVIAWALGRRLRDCGKYFLGLLALMILAMGVRLHVMGHSYPVPLPYRLLQELPFVNAARNPSRVIVYAYLFLAILVAFSVKRLFTAPDGSAKKKIALAVICCLIFADFYSVSSAKTPVELPPAYEIIKNDHAGDFGILEIPWDTGRYMMIQTLHGIPCVQGYLGRRVEKTLGDRLPYDPKRLNEQKTMLIENKVKYIIIHKKKMTYDPSNAADQKYAFVLQQVAGIYARTYERIFEDDNCSVFKVYS